MIKSTKLQQLVAFDKYGTLSKAADALHVSQPSLSRSMQEIENELQVTLFDRSKNKLTLNDNGLLAVEYAKKVLEQIALFEKSVKEYDKSKRTISIGSCAPAPLWSLLPLLTQECNGMSIISETIPDTDLLLEGLTKGSYQLIILPYILSDSEYECRHYTDEHLYLSVTPNHRLADKKTVSFSDFDGENMILFSDLGIWRNVHLSKMPHSKFLVQNERFAFDELVASSILPCFCTDLSIKYMKEYENRINIPISDEEATVSFYAVCLKKNTNLLRKIFQNTRFYLHA